METNNKVDVFHPISLFSTVGEELEQIIEIHNKDKQALLTALDWTDFKSIKKISAKNLKFIVDSLNIGTELYQYLDNFQKDYADESKKADITYSQSKKQFQKLKKAIPFLKDEFSEGIDRLEDILDYFGVATEEDIFAESESLEVLFKKHNKTKVDALNLKIWLRRGELNFEKNDLPEYNEQLLLNWIEASEWKGFVRDINYFKNLPNLFASFGVGLIYLPYLDHTVYGAVKWIDGKPLILISDIGRDLASCWFTLFHEIGHVIYHKNEDVMEGDISPSIKNSKEKQANQFANNYLCNGEELRKEIFALKSNNFLNTSTQALSRKYEICDMFVSYWLRKAQFKPSFNSKIHIQFQL